MIRAFALVLVCTLVSACAVEEDTPNIFAEPIIVAPSAESRAVDCEVGDDGIGGTGCPALE